MNSGFLLLKEKAELASRFLAGQYKTLVALQAEFQNRKARVKLCEALRRFTATPLSVNIWMGTIEVAPTPRYARSFFFSMDFLLFFVGVSSSKIFIKLVETFRTSSRPLIVSPSA